MAPIVEDNLKQITELCEKMQLQSLYLFGSATNKNYDSVESDLDFIYQFKKGMPLSSYDYFDLMFDLERITGKRIDLVAEDKINNKFFLSRINSQKIKIYES